MSSKLVCSFRPKGALARVALALAALLGAAAAGAPASAEAPAGAEPAASAATATLCAGLAGADLTVCAQLCRGFPADARCQLARRFGFRGAQAVALAVKAGRAVVDAALYLKLDAAEARRIALFADYLRLAPLPPESAPPGAPALPDAAAIRAASDAGRLEEARALVAQEVAALAARLGADHPAVADARADLVELASRASDLAGARALATQVLADLEAVLGPDAPRTISAVDTLAGLALRAADLSAAEALYRRNLAACRAVLGPRHVSTATTLSNLGKTLLDRGDAARARPLLEEALAMKRELLGPADPSTAITLDHLGVALSRQGDLAGAAQRLQAAYEALLAALGPAHPDTAATAGNLARVLLVSGEAPRAIGLLRAGLAAVRARYGPDHPEVAQASVNLGQALATVGDLGEARDLVASGLTVLERRVGPEHPATAVALASLAGILGQMGDAEGAANTLARACDLLERALGPRHPDTLTCRVSEARALTTLGLKDRARALLDAALTARAAAFGPDSVPVAEALAALGALEERAGDAAAARRAYERALSLLEARLGADDPALASVLGVLARLELETGTPSAADARYARALPLAERAGDPGLTSALHLGRAVALTRLGRRRDAAPHLAEALTLARRRLLDQADAAPSDLHLLSFLGSSRGFLFEALGILDRPQDAAAALDVVLAWQGLGTSREQRWRALQRARAEASEEERGRIARFLALQRGPQSAAAAEELRRLGGELSSSSRDALTAAADVAAASTRAACRALAPSRGALVAYVRREASAGEARYLAFTLTSPGCKAARYDLGPAEAVDDAVGAYLTAAAEVGGCLERRDAAFCAAALARLDDAGRRVRALAWDPLARGLGATERIFVAADGRLAEVPLEGLADTRGRYLIEDRALVYLPFPAAVVGAASAGSPLARAGARRALVAGDIDYQTAAADVAAAVGGWRACDAGGCAVGAVDLPALAAAGTPSRGAAVCGAEARWAPLPDTEAAAIAATLGAARAGVVLARGPSATEAALREALPGADLIHLATHGFYSPVATCGDGALAPIDVTAPSGGHGMASLVTFYTDPLRLSAVVLAGANGAPKGADAAQDGLLSAREVAGLDLRGTELVVLSACETGRGEPVAGEGAQGLGRAFIVAGARAVIVSLWQVPSGPTAELFEQLYRAAYAPGASLGASDALRRARLAVLTAARAAGIEHSAALWAAFIPIVGR